MFLALENIKYTSRADEERRRDTRWEGIEMGDGGIGLDLTPEAIVLSHHSIPLEGKGKERKQHSTFFFFH